MENRQGVERRVILDAALAEVVAKGIDEFTIEGAAARAGVDPAVITQVWGDRRVLLLEAQIGAATEWIPVPDTGRDRKSVV